MSQWSYARHVRLERLELRIQGALVGAAGMLFACALARWLWS